MTVSVPVLGANANITVLSVTVTVPVLHTLLLSLGENSGTSISSFKYEVVPAHCIPPILTVWKSGL
jgi:hypothetical protein